LEAPWERLQRKTLSSLTMTSARPCLVAWAFFSYMAHGRHPDLLQRCVFHLWHGCLVKGRWADTCTEVSRLDAEAPAPPTAESKSSAFSFAFPEQLGVNVPPIQGRVPRVSEDEQEEDTLTSPTFVEWYVNTFSTEWIYHTTEEMYFHLPTSSLWERREVTSCDPMAASHTFFRVDAVHLQALSHFASSMDQALVPLAWKAWTRFVRKRRDRTVNAPPTSPDGNVKGPDGKVSANYPHSISRSTSSGQRKSERRRSKEISANAATRSAGAGSSSEDMASGLSGTELPASKAQIDVVVHASDRNDVSQQQPGGPDDGAGVSKVPPMQGQVPLPTEEPQPVPPPPSKVVPSAEASSRKRSHTWCTCLCGRRRKVEYNSQQENSSVYKSTGSGDTRSEGGEGIHGKSTVQSFQRK